jgi:two-component system chemotaxis response regulator CheB
METLIAAQELVMAPDQQELGQLAPLTCPECHGSLCAIGARDSRRFRCHTGHAFSAESLHDAQAEAWEQTLYNALRIQEEQIALVRRIASEARRRAAVRHADDIERRLRSYEEGAAIIRQLLVRGRGKAGPAQTEAAHAGSAARDELLRDLP